MRGILLVVSNRTIIPISLLLCLCLVLTLVPKPAQAADSSSSVTLISETAEESTYDEWNVQWSRFDANAASGEDYWCRTMHQVQGSGHSIYSARVGFNSHYLAPVAMPDGSTGRTQPWNVNVTAVDGTTVPQADWVMRYDTDQDSIMRKALVGGSAYGLITMTFSFYSSTGISTASQPGTGESVGYDFLNAIYYTGTGDQLVKHVLWTDTSVQAQARTWTQVSINVPNTATMVGFEFVSGTSAPTGGDAANAFTSSGVSVVNGGMQEGVYLDDILVVGSNAAPTIPLATSVDGLASLENKRTFPVGFTVNSPTDPFAYVNLYYRLGETGAWTKYATGANAAGGFTTSPITFTAASDGRYEFFTQGVDAKGNAETLRNAADAFTIVDSLSPTSSIVINPTQPSGTYTTAVSFTINVEDAGTGVDATYYWVDNRIWNAYNGTAVPVSGDGDHQIQVYSVDKAGNTEIAHGGTIKVDRTGPAIKFSEPGQTYASSSPSIPFTISDTVSGVGAVQISLDGGAFQTIDALSGTIPLINLSNGAHQLILKAQDLVGNTAQTTETFYVGTGSDGSSGSDQGSDDRGDSNPSNDGQSGSDTGSDDSGASQPDGTNPDGSDLSSDNLDESAAVDNGSVWPWVAVIGVALILSVIGFAYFRSGKKR
jgi:hypothetical protein